MNTLTKYRHWLDSRPKTKQWLWFITLWLGGLLAVMAMTYPIKLLIKSMQ